MNFSRKIQIQDALQIKVRRAKQMAKSKCNPDFNTSHPDECRDAQSKNYAKLEKRITELVEKHQLRTKVFREKLHHVD